MLVAYIISTHLAIPLSFKPPVVTLGVHSLNETPAVVLLWTVLVVAVSYIVHSCNASKIILTDYIS